MSIKFTTDAEVSRYIKETHPGKDIIFPTGFPEAFIRTTAEGAAVYNKNTMIDTLVSNDGMTRDEAIEFLEFNTWNTFMGDSIHPIYEWEGTAYSYRYDVLYDKSDGRILEDICQCESGTCEFTDAWIEDGKPTHITLEDLSKHDFEGEIIEL